MCNICTPLWGGVNISVQTYNVNWSDLLSASLLPLPSPPFVAYQLSPLALHAVYSAWLWPAGTPLCYEHLHLLLLLECVLYLLSSLPPSSNLHPSQSLVISYFFHKRERTCGICLSGLFHLTQFLPFHCECQGFILFYGWVISHGFIYHIFIIQLATHRHLGWFRVLLLWIVLQQACEAIYLFCADFISFSNVCRELGQLTPVAGLLLVFWGTSKSCPWWLSNLHSHQQCRGFPFLHISPAFIIFSSF